MKILNKRQIIALTKIKQPFLMIDKIENLIKLKSSVGLKNITKSSWFFKSHFINNPVMPGTLIEEAMLQTIVCTLYSSKKFNNKLCLITSSKTNFYRKISEPSILRIKVKILKITKLKIEAKAFVNNNDGEKIASGEYKYFISKK